MTSKYENLYRFTNVFNVSIYEKRRPRIFPTQTYFGFVNFVYKSHLNTALSKEKTTKGQRVQQIWEIMKFYFMINNFAKVWHILCTVHGHRHSLQFSVFYAVFGFRKRFENSQTHFKAIGVKCLQTIGRIIKGRVRKIRVYLSSRSHPLHHFNCYFIEIFEHFLRLSKLYRIVSSFF